MIEFLAFFRRHVKGVLLVKVVVEAGKGGVHVFESFVKIAFFLLSLVFDFVDRPLVHGQGIVGSALVHSEMFGISARLLDGLNS